jgi:hypothetical protein
MLNDQIDRFTYSIYTLQKNNFDFGLNDYPIFDEAYRPILNKAILDTYIFHEIGWNNPNVFKHYLQNRMSIIMRNKYNELYRQKAKDFNPLYTLDVYDEYSHTIENTTNGEINATTNTTNNTSMTNNATTNNGTTTESTNDALALASSYPSEDMINNDWENNVYVNNGQKNTTTTNSTDTTEETVTSNGNTNTSLTGTDTTTNSGTHNTTETYSKHSYGSASDLSFSHAMLQFKDYCDKFNLDQQVIDELKDLFINIY